MCHDNGSESTSVDTPGYVSPVPPLLCDWDSGRRRGGRGGGRRRGRALGLIYHGDWSSMRPCVRRGGVRDEG